MYNCYSIINEHPLQYPAIGASGREDQKRSCKQSLKIIFLIGTIRHQDKFFLYFANNGSGIGVITADDPTFTKNVKDPLGHEIISRNTPNSNVTWLFDPGVYYDPDTDTAIMAYGGGVPAGQAANTKQGRIVQLGDEVT